MKRTRCTTSSQVDFMNKRRKYTIPSHQVVLKDEDLLTLILLRVPYVELVSSLKSVSKQWRSLITSPHFTRLLRNSIPPLRASGLIIHRLRPAKIRSPDEVDFVSLDNPNTPFGPQNIRIIQSCNGLLLCSKPLCHRPKTFREHLREHYVYNPSTNHIETLPEHPPGCSWPWVRYVGLAFDPSKSIHYKVIAFYRTDSSPSNNVGNFYIYSSQTGAWKASVESFSVPLGTNFSGGVYWNGCIHWLSALNSESEAGSTISDCLCFNVDDERLEKFPRPPTAGVSSASRRSLYFGESEGHLHFVEACPCATSLNVYEMKSDYSGWFVKYQIDLDPISKVFPEMTKHKAIFDEKNYKVCQQLRVAVIAVIRRENFREDPFLVLEILGKIIRYNLVTGSMKMIGDLTIKNTGIDDWFFGNLRVWQYIASV